MKKIVNLHDLSPFDEFKFLKGKCLWTVLDNRGNKEIVIDNGNIKKHVWQPENGKITLVELKLNNQTV